MKLPALHISSEARTISMTMSKQQIFDFFEAMQKSQYVKKGRFLYRPAKWGETVLTVVSGKLETIRQAETNDIVLRNIELGSSAETYIVPFEKFKKRYIFPIPCFGSGVPNQEEHKIDGISWRIAIAKGEIEACRYKGETFQFESPWKEFMICCDGDYIARPIGGEKNDIYRIEKETFKATYSEKK